jgi:FkbM family methyltransferase
MTKPIVVDCGANHGEFTREMVRAFDACVIAVEPNPVLYGDVERAGAAQVLSAAIAEGARSVWLSLDDNDEASTIVPHSRVDTEQVEVAALSLSTLLDQLGFERIDLLKLDIEGAELRALEGLTRSCLDTIDQLAVEFHDAQGWTRPPDIRRLCRRMRRAGFRAIRMSVQHWGDVLFVRRRRLSRLEQWRVCWIERPLELMTRALQRGSAIRIRAHGS